MSPRHSPASPRRRRRTCRLSTLGPQGRGRTTAGSRSRRQRLPVSQRVQRRRPVPIEQALSHPRTRHLPPSPNASSSAAAHRQNSLATRQQRPPGSPPPATPARPRSASSSCFPATGPPTSHGCWRRAFASASSASASRRGVNLARPPRGTQRTVEEEVGVRVLAADSDKTADLSGGNLARGAAT